LNANSWNLTKATAAEKYVACRTKEPSRQAGYKFLSLSVFCEKTRDKKKMISLCVLGWNHVSWPFANEIESTATALQYILISILGGAPEATKGVTGKITS
jgi:hypothetical protein